MTQLGFWNDIDLIRKEMLKGAKLQSIHNPFEKSRVYELLVKFPGGIQYIRVPVESIQQLLDQKKIRTVETHPWKGATDYEYRLMHVYNANELLDMLKLGAKLKSWWVNGKQVHSVKLPSGEILHTQRSNISALINRGVISSIAFSGNNYEYYLVESSNVQSTG